MTHNRTGIRIRLALPLLVALVAQAFLIFYHLDLLDAWGDELFTWNTVTHSLSEIVPILQRDVHPPLYFFLLHGWMQVPLPWTGIAALRAFSAVMAMLCTVLIDQFWLRGWRLSLRCLGLALFAFSPCLLLYGRMARSYSMQAALAMVALFFLWRWMERPHELVARALPAWAAMVLLLYTHYLPGLAILAGFALTGGRPVGRIRIAAWTSACLAAYAPWITALAASLARWGQTGAHYQLARGPVLEQAFKTTFALISLTIGESFTPLVLLLVPLSIWMIWRGCRIRTPGLPGWPTIAVSAIIGYIGATRWVAWPFVPARLLWLLPFLVLALTIGLLRSSVALRYGLAAAILLSYASSCVYYFRRENFINLGYVAPVREIANKLRTQASPRDVILADAFNGDAEAIRHYLGSGFTFVGITGESAPQAREVARGSGVGAVWIVRSTRDISPGGLITSIEADVCKGRASFETLYEPIPAWERAAMQIVTGAPAPEYFYRLTLCR